jgi:hypothetical protein
MDHHRATTRTFDLFGLLPKFACLGRLDLDDHAAELRFLIRDRIGKFSTASGHGLGRGTRLV